MQYKTLYTLFNSAPDLSKFVTKLEQIEQISQLVTSHLEPALGSQCRVANLREGTLIISTTSPAWHHQLRFQSLDLLSQLRARPEWCGLKSIEVRVDYLPVHEHNTKTNLKKPLTMSSNNAKLLEDTANSVTCPKLAKSLQRLSARSKPTKQEN